MTMNITQIAPNALCAEPLTRPVLELYRKLPGKKRVEGSRLLIEASRENLDVVIQVAPHVAEAEIPIIMNHLGIRPEPVPTQERVPDEASSVGFQMGTEPFDHQRQAFGRSRHLEYFALFMEMGTGKTKVLIDTAFSLFYEGHIDAMLVFAPNGVHAQWVNEQLPIHAAKDLPWEAVSWTRKQRNGVKEKIASIMLNGKTRRLRIFSVGYDSLASEKTKKAVRDFIQSAGGRVLVAFDESHKLKSYKSGRTIFCTEVAGKCSYRRIATGTEVTEGVEDLFSQMGLLRQNILGHSSFFGFRNEYCITQKVDGAPRGVVKVIGYKTVDKLRNRVARHSFLIKKNECLDLPEKVYTKRMVPLTDEQRDAYRSLKNDLIHILKSSEQVGEDGNVVYSEATVEHAASLLIRLQQITSGHLPDDDGNIHTLPTNRIQAVLDVLEESKTAIVWARFVHDIEALNKALIEAGYRVGLYYGATKGDERTRIVKPGEVDVLVCNQQSAAAGLNLMHFNTAIYFSNTFVAADRWQSEDRIHRIGQNSKCTYVDLVSPGTIDAKILRALRDKKNIADLVRDGGDHFLLDLLSDAEE